MRQERGGNEGFTLVELLATVMILGIVMTGITSVVITTMRSEQYQRELQDVVDDGRVSLQRIRQELRGARRVMEPSSDGEAGSTGRSLHVWIDQNQNSKSDGEPEELVCYVVEPLPGGATPPTQWQITRWDHAIDADDCRPGALPAGQTRRIVATTLVSPDPDDPTVEPQPFRYTPAPGGIADPPTREVTITLDLEVVSARGPDSVQVESSIRLRNVP